MKNGVQKQERQFKAPRHLRTAGKRGGGYGNYGRWYPRIEAGPFAHFDLGVAWHASPTGAIGTIRRIVRQSTLAQSYLRQTRINVVGAEGPRPTFATVQNANDRKKLEMLWEQWTKAVTDDGINSWGAMLRSFITSWARDGRVLALIRTHTDYPFNYALRPLARDWLVSWHSAISTPVNIQIAEDKGPGYDLVAGKILQKSGRVKGYMFWGDAKKNRQHMDTYGGYLPYTTLVKHGAPIFIPKASVVDMLIPHEADDVIGFPGLMLPIISMLLHIARLDESMAVTMEAAADKMGFITREMGSQSFGIDEDFESDEYTTPDQFERNTIEALPPGYDFTAFNPSAPNQNITDYRRMMLKNVAAALGTDYAGISGDLREVNFSSIRQGVQNARDSYKVIQKDLENTVCRPVLAGLLNAARLGGYLKISEKSYMSALRSHWQHRKWSYVDPLKEVKASETLLAMGATSLQEVCAAHGLDWRTVLAQTAEVKDEIEALGIEDYIRQPGLDFGTPGVEEPAPVEDK